MVCTIQLEVKAGASSDEYTTQVVRSPVGAEPSATMHLNAEKLLDDRGDLETAVLLSSMSGRRVAHPEEQRLQNVGRVLFEALFTDGVLDAYLASITAARERGEPLRVEFRTTVPELAALPWEALWDSNNGNYICLAEPLVRHVPAPYTSEPLEVTPPLRILGLVASPRGLPALDISAEQEGLQSALAPLISGGLLELEWLVQASWAGVQEKLLSNHWHVLHFIGHGDYDVDTDEGLLALVGGNGRAENVPASHLAYLLSEARPTPRLVVLNSCSSGEESSSDLFSGTAAVLARSGISAVAAMQFTISDAAAISFASGFYTAIAHGRSVDNAVRSGRIAILGTPRTLEWVTPVLYLRGDNTQLFTLTASPQRSVAPQPEAEDRSAQTTAKLDALYSRARTELNAEHYEVALGLLNQLLNRAPDYPEAAALRNTAAREVDLADKYQRAIDKQYSGHWVAADDLFTTILRAKPGYRDAVARRRKCRKARKIADLQAELRCRAETADWRAVADTSDELARLDSGEADPGGLATRARQILAAADREAELAHSYARARKAEDLGDWATAIKDYTASGSYQDAETRLNDCRQQQSIARLKSNIDQYAETKDWRRVRDTVAELRRIHPASAAQYSTLDTRARRRSIIRRKPLWITAIAAFIAAGATIIYMVAIGPRDNHGVWNVGDCAKYNGKFALTKVPCDDIQANVKVQSFADAPDGCDAEDGHMPVSGGYACWDINWRVGTCWALKTFPAYQVPCSEPGEKHVRVTTIVRDSTDVTRCPPDSPYHSVSSVHHFVVCGQYIGPEPG